MILKTTYAVLAIAGLAGCAGVDVAQYKAEKPAFDLARYFNGTVDGWGMFQDRSGKVVRRFTVRIDARWDGDNGTLDEHFEFADGEKQNRVWKLVRTTGRSTSTSSSPTARSRTASGSSSGTATATSAPPATSSAKARARQPAMRSISSTCSRCRSTDGSGTSTWTTGCS